MQTQSPLAEWRRKSRLTMTTLATAAGVKRQTIANWEKGLGGPQAKHIVLLSRLAPGLPTALGLIGNK